MAIQRTLQPDVYRLCIPRANVGKGMINTEDCVEIETNSLKQYVENSNERLLNDAEEGVLGGGKTKKEVLVGRENAKKGKRGNVNGCIKPSSENKQHKEQSWQTKCFTPM